LRWQVSGTGITGLLPPVPNSLVSLDISSTNIQGLTTTSTSLQRLYASASKLSESSQLALSFFSAIRTVDISDTGITAIDGFPSTLVELDASGSDITGTLPALPASITYLDVSDTGIAAFASISSASNLATLLAGDARLAAVPSPLPFASLTYVGAAIGSDSMHVTDNL
jgi:Leucine-rich repeat (LRR) protein